MFELQDCQLCEFRNFRVAGNAGKQLKAVFGITNIAGGSFAASRNIFRDILIDGDSAGPYIDNGFQVYETVVANNDLNLFENVQVQHTTTAGFDIQSSPSNGNYFYHCGASSTQYGLYLRKGHFDWLGGTMADNSVTDFYVGWGARGIDIRNIESEGSNRLLVADYDGGPTGTLTPITLSNVLWYSGSMAADDYAIIYKYTGNLILENVQFASNDIPKIDVSAGPAHSLTMRNCQWFKANSKDTNVLNLAAHNIKLVIEGNLFCDSSDQSPVDTEVVTAATYTLADWKPATTFDTTSNAIAATLPDGHMIGQRKILSLSARPGSNNVTLTVTNHADGDGGTYTFDAVGETVVLEWMGTDWIEIKAQGTTFVP